MRQELRETIIIFLVLSIWSILAISIGIAVGLSTTIFLKVLNWCTHLTTQNSYYYLSLPFALLLSALCTKYLASDADGHGTEKVIEVIHKNSGKIKTIIIPVKLITSVITIACSGSAGKEGSCAQNRRRSFLFSF